MKKKIPKKTHPDQQKSGTMETHKYELYIQQLRALEQPWNHVVRAAIGFLECDNSPSFCDVAVQEYGYAETLQEAGCWNCNGLSEHARRSAICIVLKGRVEIVGDYDPPKRGINASFTSVRPVPFGLLEEGGILGSYEFTGNIFERPETHNYKVMSGPVCLQFNHEHYSAFKQNKTPASNPLIGIAPKPPDGRTPLDAWVKTGNNFELIKCLSDPQACKEPHARVLFLSPNNVSHLREGELLIWETFRNSIVEAAWAQSSRVRFEAFDQKIGMSESGSSKYLEAIRNLRSSHEFMWSPLLDSSCYPAIESFLEKTTRENSVRLEKDQIFGLIKPSQTSRPAYISLIDIGHRFIQDEEYDGHVEEQSVVPYSLNHKWKLHDPFYNGDKKRLLEVHEDLTKLHAQLNDQLKDEGAISNGSWPLSIVSTEPVNSKNPFRRLHLKIQKNLNSLPVVDLIEREYCDIYSLKLDLSGVLIVACQHLLRETLCWFSRLLAAGARIVVTGKDYSTCPHVALQMRLIGIDVVDIPTYDWEPGGYGVHLQKKIATLWERSRKAISNWQCKEVIVIDDGGHLLKTVPADIARMARGIEQTTSGIEAAEQANIPVVCVASSPEKRDGESQLIANAIVARTQKSFRPFSAGDSIGVLGVGAIGGSLILELEKMNLDLKIRYCTKKLNYPNQEWKAENLACIEELVRESDIVFGCTGTDVLGEDVSLQNASGKWFISCGSMDNEFGSLLRLRENGIPLARFFRPGFPFSTVIVGDSMNNYCQIANGGFPVNFDRKSDSVPLQSIQSTRGLMHLGLLQVKYGTSRKPGRIDLDFFSKLDEKKRYALRKKIENLCPGVSYS